MKSRWSIEMNYKRALSQAAQLEEASEALRRTAVSAIADISRDLSGGGWQGENADAFLKKLSLLTERIQTSAKQLRDAAAALRRIAQNTYDAEMRALDLAVIRSY